MRNLPLVPQYESVKERREANPLPRYLHQGPNVYATVEKAGRSLPDMASGISQHPLPSAQLVRLFLMAHCSVVTNGYIVFILQRELMCVKHMQE
jgi:hypothetical protein